MLYTEPEVQAGKHKLGRFRDYPHQEHADLEYGGQGDRLRALKRKPPETRPPSTIPAPPTPPTR